MLDDRVVQIEHLDGICELIINKPTTNDSGLYVCEAKNKLGTQQTQHSVVVDVHQGSRRSSILSSIMSEKASQAGEREHVDTSGRPPRKGEEEGDASYERRSKMPDATPKQQLYFTANLSNRYVAVGSKVKLQAVVSGPDPIIKWQKDDGNVTYGPKIRNQNRDSLACLEFLSCQLEDAGTYTLLVQNEYCKIQQRCTLSVFNTAVDSDVTPVFVRPIKGKCKYVLATAFILAKLCNTIMQF